MADVLVLGSTKELGAFRSSCYGSVLRCFMWSRQCTLWERGVEGDRVLSFVLCRGLGVGGRSQHFVVCLSHLIINHASRQEAEVKGCSRVVVVNTLLVINASCRLRRM